jgi:hypothetical protein
MNNLVKGIGECLVCKVFIKNPEISPAEIRNATQS